MQEFLKKPSTDFGAVRDGRQALPFYVDIDLTTARSIAAGTALKLDIAGNSFFTDADTSTGGNGIVHFQDTSLGISSAPFFVSPGFIANVGFTQLLIENTAQAGKKMRIFYGVDIDFQAGVNTSSTVINSTQVRKTFSQSELSVGAADTPILASNNNRDYLLIQNKHASQNIWVRLDGGAGASGVGVLIGPGGSLELSNTVPTNAIRGYASGAATNITIVEA